MINSEEIKPDMLVHTAQAEEFATIDHLYGPDSIKLKKDENGNHHYIPLSWVISTEGGIVKVNRTLNQAIVDWSSVPLDSLG